MADIKIIDNGDGGDFDINNGDITADDGFATAIYSSLFSGDSFYNAFTAFKTTNNFCKTLNLPVTINNLKQTEVEANNALHWITEANIVKELSCNAYGCENSKINLEIQIIEPNETVKKYGIIWQNESYNLRIG